MTESDWLTSVNPAAMLAHVDPPGPPRASLRKLRLFAAACLRLDGLEKTATALEQFADDGDELALLKVWKLGRPPIAFGTVAGTRIYAVDLAKIGPQASRAQVLRCIFGNPFRPLSLRGPCPNCQHDPCACQNHWERRPVPWVTPAVCAVAQVIYDERRWELMPALADCLEEAGCVDAAILGHCRGLVLCHRCFGDGKDRRPGCEGLCHECFGAGWVRPRCPACNSRGEHSQYGAAGCSCSTCKGTGHAPAVYCRGDHVVDAILGKF